VNELDSRLGADVDELQGLEKRREKHAGRSANTRYNPVKSRS
jgi:hypothetical protein